MAEPTPAPTSNTPPRARRSSLDLVVVLVLIAALAGMTLLASRARRSAGATAPAGLAPVEEPERVVLPEQVGYRERAPIPFTEKIRALAIGPEDHLFVSVGFAVVELSPEGKELRRFELQTAASCLAAHADKLYLGCSDHIEVLTPADGSKVAWPAAGTGAFLVSLAVGQDTVVAGDSGLRRYHRWKPDGTALGEVAGNPAAGATANAGVPSTYYDVAAAADGTFWATDAGHFGLVHMDAQGQSLGRFGKGSEAIEDFGGCCNPTQVAVAPGGILVTVEKKPDLVKTYRTDGSFVSVVAGPKAFQAKTFVPDVAADSRGRIALVDPKAKSVRIFEPKTAEP